jgi:hypothetical protein
VIDYLKAEGVKQQAKGDRITFESLTPWPGNFIGASGTFIEGANGPERRAAVLNMARSVGRTLSLPPERRWMRASTC